MVGWRLRSLCAVVIHWCSASQIVVTFFLLFVRLCYSEIVINMFLGYTNRNEILLFTKAICVLFFGMCFASIIRSWNLEYCLYTNSTEQKQKLYTWFANRIFWNNAPHKIMALIFIDVPRYETVWIYHHTHAFTATLAQGSGALKMI